MALEAAFGQMMPIRATRNLEHDPSQDFHVPEGLALWTGNLRLPIGLANDSLQRVPPNICTVHGLLIGRIT